MTVQQWDNLTIHQLIHMTHQLYGKDENSISGHCQQHHTTRDSGNPHSATTTMTHYAKPPPIQPRVFPTQFPTQPYGVTDNKLTPTKATFSPDQNKMPCQQNHPMNVTQDHDWTRVQKHKQKCLHQANREWWLGSVTITQLAKRQPSGHFPTPPSHLPMQAAPQHKIWANMEEEDNEEVHKAAPTPILKNWSTIVPLHSTVSDQT